MKKIFFVCMLSLFCCLVMNVSKAQAQYVYYYTDVQYVPQYRYVDGYTTTWLDYYAGLYYDPAVLGELYRTDMNETPLDAGYDEGYADLIDAEVYLFTRNYVEGKTYCTSGVHFIIDAYTGQRSVVRRYYPCITVAIQTPPPPPSPRPVANVESIEFQTINSPVLNDNPSALGGGSRIFPDRLAPDDDTNMRIVRVEARLNQAVTGTRVYFRNFDIDDPESDPEIDPDNNSPNDNRGERGPQNEWTPQSAGTLSAVSALSNNGIATVDFTVTMQPGDNFVISASTDPDYSNGIRINGTGAGLEDSSGNQLPTTRAMQTNPLYVWRKVHLEVDSMWYVGGNVAHGYIQSKGSVNQTPVWINLYSSTGPLEAGRFRGGRLTIGSYNLRVLDNTTNQVQVVSESGIFYYRINQLYALFDDDDFNSDDGVLQNGDDGEDVTWRCLNNTYPCDILSSETFSLLRPSANYTENPYADAYIEPNYTWAEQQPGMNDTDVQFELNVENIPFANTPNERAAVDRKRDSDGMERNDFWIGYLLVGYQWDTELDADPFDLTVEGIGLGIAPADNVATDANNRVTRSSEVRKGAIGAMVFIETMRDVDVSAGPQAYRATVKTAPHELGHQFGIKGDDDAGYCIMYVSNGCLEFVTQHINIMRWRISSPGQN